MNNKDKVINDLLKRIADLEYKIEEQENKNNKAIEYLKEHKPVCSSAILMNILLEGKNK